jgi:hypothetical protein
MTVNDVKLVRQQTADHLNFTVQPSDAVRRLTLQHFDNRDIATTALAPHNSDAKLSDSDDWPPPLIFDVAYGCAALKTWGVSSFINFARAHTRDIYYNDADHDDDENGDGSSSSSGRPTDDVSGGSRHDQQAHERKARAARRQEEKSRTVGRQASNTPDFADMILALWMRNARKGQCQAHTTKVDRTREKVRTWLDSAEQ